MYIDMGSARMRLINLLSCSHQAFWLPLLFIASYIHDRGVGAGHLPESHGRRPAAASEPAASGTTTVLIRARVITDPLSLTLLRPPDPPTRPYNTLCLRSNIHFVCARHVRHYHPNH